MKFTVLIENSLEQDHNGLDDLRMQASKPLAGQQKLTAEHGLGIYFEIDGKRWLLDTGASSAFAQNARILGVDLKTVDYLILSHAHADHTGGLETFLELNPKAQIYLSAHIDGRKYYSTRHGGKKDISINMDAVKARRERFHFVSTATELTPSVSIITSIPSIYAQPKANATLLAGDVMDDFSHEIAVKIKEPDGITILSSCSHRGLLNTLAACGDVSVKAYIGGLHLPDSDTLHCFETNEEISDIARLLKEKYPALSIYTGHCTGTNAMRLLSEALGERLIPIYTGFRN